jgi:hypothetical protein
MSGSLINQLANPPMANPQYWGGQMQNLNALQDFAAKQATAKIYQDPTVVNPLTGGVDQGRLNMLVSQSPAASWNAAQIMQQQGQAAAAQGQGALETLAAHRARMDSMLGQMNGLLTKGTPIKIGDIQSALNQAHLSPAEAQTITQDVNSASGGDPNFDFTNWVKNHQAANLNAQGQIALRTPNIQFQSTPQGLVATDMNPNTTTTPAGTAIPYGLGPNDQYWDPNTKSFVKAGSIVPPGTVTPPGGAPGGGGGGANVPRDTSMTAGQQANNSGNLMVPPSGNLPTGATGAIRLSGGRQVAAFPDVPTGIAAQSDNLAAYKAAGVNTIRGAVTRWVGDPKADLGSYTADIAKAAGVDPDAPVDLTDPKIQKAFFMAQQPHESGKPWLNPADVDKGLALAQARRAGAPGTTTTAAATPPAPGKYLVASNAPVAPPTGSATQFQYPNGKTGGPPDAQGAVRYTDGSYGTPPPGRPIPVTAAAPTVPPPAPAPAPAAPPAAAPPAPARGPLMAGPPMGLETTIEGRAKASVDMANAMHAQAAASPQRQAILADMDATNKQINTGPAAEASTKWGAFVNQLPENVSSLIPGMSRAQVAGTEGFAKLAETFRQMQAGGIAGTLTNDKFASALASNPHLALSTLGNQGMIHLLQGSEDALQAKDRAWQTASGANPSLDYQTWETNFNKSFDPRVFWWSRMERPEQQRLMAGMGDQQKQTLLSHLKQAEADGLITRPGGQGG